MNAVLIISGTSSDVGKTTVTVGLMAAFASRGYIVQPFKCGPDFLDGMHHEAAIRSGEEEWLRRQEKGDHNNDESMEQNQRRTGIKQRRRCVNLDGWMMRYSSAVLSSFHNHAQGADICIIEGAMGLHDSKDGTSSEGSAAEIAKLLHAPVVLVIDASKMARSVAAMALGYALFDVKMRLGGVIVNKVGGVSHIKWIKEALEGEERLKDVATIESVLFAGAMPFDKSICIPERHLGLTMPKKEHKEEGDRYFKLALLVEECLDLDGLLKLGRTCQVPPPLPNEVYLEQEQDTSMSRETANNKCRIGIAEDEAFCFYYHDNLDQLQSSGADLIPFSPLTSPHLPPKLDAIYIGGGYPELHADQLEQNKSLRKEISSFCNAGGMVYAECGGLMYLSQGLYVLSSKKEGHDTNKSFELKEMCGIFPFSVRMTPHMKMYYADVEFTSYNPVFPVGGTCRGQKFHFSEIIHDDDVIMMNKNNENEIMDDSPLLVTPQLPGALPEHEGYREKNTFASYFHLHFTSYYHNNNNNSQNETATALMSHHFIQNAILTSPYRNINNGNVVVSFVSAATEIIFALDAQSALAGVTSICDFPLEAQYAPRQIVCRSSMDASSMTSEEVDAAMELIQQNRVIQSNAENGGGSSASPGYWIIDTKLLQEINPDIVFVQNTCEICDTSLDDVLHALNVTGLESTTRTIPVAPTTLEGLFDSIIDISTALEIKERGMQLVLSLRDRLLRVKNELLKLKNAPKLKVLSLEGLAPLCTGGNWLPDLKLAAGCIDAFEEIGGCPARIISWEKIVAADPDILMISPCSASPARTLNELHLLASSSEFWSLRCVKNGNVYIIDHECFSRPGPRLVEGVEMMATLFRNIPPPSISIYSKWNKEALKYHTDDKGILHLTTSTELAGRFTPCFDNQIKSVGDEIKNTLRLCNVTKCTIPGMPPLPPNRSAHCIVPIQRGSTSNKISLLLIGGENQDAQRLNDTWELHLSNGWSNASNYSNVPSSTPVINATWEYLACGKVAGEDVPTRRSNHAAVACRDHILIFGGWGVDNVTPLSHCELLHIDSLCWTHCSTRGNGKGSPEEPSPRGNPTLVYSEKCNFVLLFGGWNGVHAMNDLWALDMNIWLWRKLDVSKCDQMNVWPSARTDHTAVLWNKNDEYNTMLVFGGTVDGSGPTSELWAFEYSSNVVTQTNGIGSYNWYILEVSGPCPPARTSHTAAIIGTGNNAKMIIVGGTDSARGTGRGSMLCDAWVLHLGGYQQQHTLPTWMRLDWDDTALLRCRHSMAIVDDATIILWGGYDGETTIQECAAVWQGGLTNILEKDDNTSNPSIISGTPTKKKQHQKLQERWEAEIPVCVEDLPHDILTKAKKSKLPGALYKAIHRYAAANNRNTYIDPASGYSVFSTVYLKRRECCGNGCRHCPYGHVNVPGKKKLCCDEKSNLDW